MATRFGPGPSHICSGVSYGQPDGLQVDRVQQNCQLISVDAELASEVIGHGLRLANDLVGATSRAGGESTPV